MYLYTRTYVENDEYPIGNIGGYFKIRISFNIIEPLKQKQELFLRRNRITKEPFGETQ